MSVMLWECSWLSKIYSESKSRVSKVRNSGDIFTLFSPQSKGPCSKTVRESCPQIRVRPKNNLSLAPRTIGFGGMFFYNVWQKMEPPELVVSTPWTFFFSFGVPKGKNFLWGTKRKKSSSRSLKKKEVFNLLWCPKGSFFPLVPQRKKIWSGGGGPGQFFIFFWQFFSTCEKITQILEFSKYQGGKI